MKVSTIALVLRPNSGNSHEILEILSDEREISLLEAGVVAGDADPLSVIQVHRAHQAKEDEEFADYVEDLLSQPFLKPEIQDHGVQWLKSRIRIQQYQKSEAEAAQVIAGYAMKIFTGNPAQKDFVLASPQAQVRVRVFVVPADAVRQAA